MLYLPHICVWAKHKIEGNRVVVLDELSRLNLTVQSTREKSLLDSEGKCSLWLSLVLPGQSTFLASVPILQTDLDPSVLQPSTMSLRL